MMQDDEEERVIYVGNAWVMRKSKSHGGRLYYFNTLTGESAWNLSESDIARARTSLHTNWTTNTLAECHESLGAPDPSENNRLQFNVARNCGTPGIYNEQIINNQFTEPYHAHRPSTELLRSHAINNQLTLGMPEETYNQKNFANNSPQIMIIPSLNNLYTYNNTQESPFGNVSVPVSSRFRVINSMTQDQLPQEIKTPSTFRRRLNQNNFRGRGSFSHINNQRKDDLRLLLEQKRKNYDYESSKRFSNEFDEPQASTSSRNFLPEEEDTLNEHSFVDEDTSWLEQNTIVQGEHLVIDVSYLRQLAPNGAKMKWYIVVDTSVLLNHLIFLSILLSSDCQCNLMIPKCVRLELQKATFGSTSQLITRARRALRFISEQVEAENAEIGELEITKCCLLLRDKNYHVVLLCNNEDFQHRFRSLNIPIFTIKALKRELILKKYSEREQPPLEIFKETETNTTSENKILQFDIKTTKVYDDLIEKNAHVKSREIQIQTELTLPQKNTTDVGIQANDNLIAESTDVPNEFSSIFRIRENTTIQTPNGAFTNLNDQGIQINSTPPAKHRNIKLNRSVPNQTSTSYENSFGSKQLRWRRTRQNNLNTIESKSMKVDESVPERSDKSEKPNESILNKISANNDWNYSNNSRHDDDNDAESDVDSFCKLTSSRLNIVLEETSTSGVVSNTASNVDSESTFSIKRNFESISRLHKATSFNNECNNVMYQITDPKMAEYLTMRCDEWVSRFVQIMEEVLSQILQQDPPFVNNAMPPPWNVFEAAECIKQKLKEHSEVVNAADKLSRTLLTVSDDRGIINNTMTPPAFMELYSYGVHLVNALQDVIDENEDLKSASELLSRLLTEIQDSNLESTHSSFIDSFTECTKDSFQNVLVEDIVIADIEEKEYDSMQPTSVSKQDSIPDSTNISNSLTKKYNLRSNKRNPVLPDTSPSRTEIDSKLSGSKLDHPETTRKETESKSSETILKDSDTTYKETCSESSEAKIHYSDNLCEEKDSYIDKKSTFFSNLQLQEKTNLPVETEERLFEFNSENQVVEILNEPKNEEPKVIRKFTVCKEIEERLKAQNNAPCGTEELDCYEDYEQDDYNIYEELHYEDESCDQEVNDLDEPGNSEHIIEDNNDSENQSSKLSNQIEYSYMTKLMKSKMKPVFFHVHSLREALTDYATLNVDRKIEIQENIKKTHEYLLEIYKYLNRILDREANKLVNAFTLQTKNLNTYSEIVEYRTLTAKYCEQIKTLLKFVDSVRKVVTK